MMNHKVKSFFETFPILFKERNSCKSFIKGGHELKKFYLSKCEELKI